MPFLFFFQQISDFLDQGQIIFAYLIRNVLEKTTNIGYMTFSIGLMQNLLLINAF